MSKHNEAEIEQEIIAKGLTAPRITPEWIDSLIESEEYHHFPNTTATICLLTLTNGTHVDGSSFCASKENFNAELGRKIARDNARDKIWALEGYLLKQRLMEQRQQQGAK